MINPIWRGRFAIGDVLIPLRRNDPMVLVIHAALAMRLKLRDSRNARFRDQRDRAWILIGRAFARPVGSTILQLSYSAACAFTSAETWRMARAS